MITYLVIGMAVEVAWFIFCTVRKMTSLKDIQGLSMWVGYIFGSAIGVIVWPITIVGYVVVSYYPELLDD